MPSSPWRTSPLVVGLVALTLPLLLAPGALANPSAGAADRDCSDFDSQRQAQRYFIDRGGPRRDPDRLDADGNGVALRVPALPLQPRRGPATPEAAAQARPDDPRPRHLRDRRRHDPSSARSSGRAGGATPCA
jgi:hypothetical protein